MDVPHEQDHVWAILCHLSALALFIIPPIGQILGPLIIWLIKKNDMPYVNEEGKKSLNFQISMTIYMFIAFVLCFVAVGIPLLVLLLLTNIVLVIIASIKTSKKEKFQYPCTILFIK
ncbi:MAG: DUF4870 domain-containing protein [Candidatus Omnitrophica bacterium]|nr:DUF4870 domain-containing protein [Candidatus Omnitrophota bacterium]